MRVDGIDDGLELLALEDGHTFAEQLVAGAGVNVVVVRRR